MTQAVGSAQIAHQTMPLISENGVPSKVQSHAGVCSMPNIIFGLSSLMLFSMIDCTAFQLTHPKRLVDPPRRLRRMVDEGI